MGDRLITQADEVALRSILSLRRWWHGHPLYGNDDYDSQRIMALWGDADGEGRRSLYHAGAHSVFWMLWMFGMPDSVVSLVAMRVAGLPVEDNNAAVFRYGTHMLVTLHTSETEMVAPLATEIYGLDGALVQVRGDHPKPLTGTGPGAIYHYEFLPMIGVFGSPLGNPRSGNGSFVGERAVRSDVGIVSDNL